MIGRWLILFCAIGLATVGSVLHQMAWGATIYKWIDEKGVTHYSESPPPQKNTRSIEIQIAPSTPDQKGGAAGKTLQQQELEFQKRRKEREAGAAKEEAENRAARSAESDMKRKCAEAKARIEMLQKERRGLAPIPNAKGEVEWLNVEQRGIELNKLGAFVDQNCQRD